MTIEEIKTICNIYDNLRNEQHRGAIAYNSEDTFFNHVLTTYNLTVPDTSFLPINEAAESYCDKVNHRQTYLITDAFKAGAKWMAEQGESEEDILKGDEDGRPIIRLKYSLRHLSDKFKPGDNVIVQIRKKEK